MSIPLIFGLLFLTQILYSFPTLGNKGSVVIVGSYCLYETSPVYVNNREIYPSMQVDKVLSYYYDNDYIVSQFATTKNGYYVWTLTKVPAWNHPLKHRIHGN